MLECLSDGPAGGDLVVCKLNGLHAALLLIFANAAESLKVCSGEVAVIEVYRVLILSQHAHVLLSNEVLFDCLVGDLDVPLCVLFIHLKDEELGPELAGLFLSRNIIDFL